MSRLRMVVHIRKNDIAETALAIRNSVNAVNYKYIGYLIHTIDTLEDVCAITPSFQDFLGDDFAITRWRELGIYEYD